MDTILSFFAELPEQVQIGIVSITTLISLGYILKSGTKI